MEHGLAVETTLAEPGMALRLRAEFEARGDEVSCHLSARARSERPAHVVLALRPCNPEGISFIDRIELDADRRGWEVDGRRKVRFSDPAERHLVSHYRAGDVFPAVRNGNGEDGPRIDCPVGMATAAAMFRLQPGMEREIVAEVPQPVARVRHVARPTWDQALRGHARLQAPDAHIRMLYEAALRSLVLHSVDDVYPGPYTYRRFWFRDAAFIINGLLCAGLTERCERALDRFPERQTPLGFFHSQ